MGSVIMKEFSLDDDIKETCKLSLLPVEGKVGKGRWDNPPKVWEMLYKGLVGECAFNRDIDDDNAIVQLGARLKRRMATHAMDTEDMQKLASALSKMEEAYYKTNNPFMNKLTSHCKTIEIIKERDREIEYICKKDEED